GRDGRCVNGRCRPITLPQRRAERSPYRIGREFVNQPVVEHVARSTVVVPAASPDAHETSIAPSAPYAEIPGRCLAARGLLDGRYVPLHLMNHAAAAHGVFPVIEEDSAIDLERIELAS